MIYPVQFAVLGCPSQFDIPKTIEAGSVAEAIRKAEAQAYGLCARSVKIFPPGTKNLSRAQPLDSRTCDYSANDA